MVFLHHAPGAMFLSAHSTYHSQQQHQQAPPPPPPPGTRERDNTRRMTDGHAMAATLERTRWKKAALRHMSQLAALGQFIVGPTWQLGPPYRRGCYCFSVLSAAVRHFFNFLTKPLSLI